MSTVARMGIKNGAVADLVMWKDIKKSAGVLAVGTVLYVVFELSGFTLIEMTATVAMVFTFSCTLWSFISGYIGRESVPLPSFVTNGISEEQARKLVVERGLPLLNKAFASITTIAKGEDKMFNLKAVAALWLAAKIGHYFSVLTFLYLVLVLMMSVPKIYDMYHEEIDKVLDQVLTKLKELKAMAEQKLKPMLDKLPKAKPADQKPVEPKSE